MPGVWGRAVFSSKRSYALPLGALSSCRLAAPASVPKSPPVAVTLWHRHPPVPSSPAFALGPVPADFEIKKSLWSLTPTSGDAGGAAAAVRPSLRGRAPGQCALGVYSHLRPEAVWVRVSWLVVQFSRGCEFTDNPNSATGE